MAKSSPPHAKRAFTLIEMLVVVAIISILLGAAIWAYQGALERAKAIKDMSNLRQIGTATQLYMNDNSGVFPGSATQIWMAQLELNQKYLSTWRVLESPFDARPTSDQGGGTNAMVSYGINSNVYSGGAAISTDKISKPTAFIVFAPAQESGTTTSFQGVGTSSAPGVTVLGAMSTPPGANAQGGTHNNRKKINAIFADWHVESMLWNGTGPAFTNMSDPGSDPDAPYRWCPQPPCP